MIWRNCWQAGRRFFDFDEESIVIKTTEEAYQFDQWDGFNYNEKHCRFFNKFCRFSLGGIDFEIIEPMDKEARSPFSDFLFENGGSGIHHIGVKVDDMPALERKMKAMGVPVLNHAVMGQVLADGTRKNCTFYDLRKQLGLILECGSLVVGPMAGSTLDQEMKGLKEMRRNLPSICCSRSVYAWRIWSRRWQTGRTSLTLTKVPS